jgi:type IV pilus assembly protein PilV
MTLPRQINKHAGCLLLEVMVAMIIILIGVVGIAKLQHVAKSSNGQALQRTEAIMLADDLIERIRSNISGMTGYFTGSTIKVISGIPSSTPPATCSSSSPCTAKQMADYDLWEWHRDITGAFESESGTSTGGLVNPTVCLVGPGYVSATNHQSGFYDIAIAWHGQNQIGYQSISGNILASGCGTTDAGKYDADGNDNVYRRVHWQRVFLDI